MDPNHVLQDEDSLCQDLQGLPQLLHPLTLVGRKQPGSGLATEEAASPGFTLRPVPLMPQFFLLPWLPGCFPHVPFFPEDILPRAEHLAWVGECG